MTGHRAFRELTKGFSPKRKARGADKVAAFETALALHELRKRRAVDEKRTLRSPAFVSD